MGEPAVGRGSVPMLYARGNIYYFARAQFLCRFAPFLVKPPSSHADEDLPAAAFGALVTLAFSLWPLGRAVRVSPTDLFRDLVLPAQADSYDFAMPGGRQGDRLVIR